MLPTETSTPVEIATALTQWLEYGELTQRDGGPCDHQLGHGSYFSGEGWAARALRYHLRQVQEDAERTRAGSSRLLNSSG